MRKILITSALPYANGSIHLGHLVEYIQTDIWVRFQKMQGHEAYYVCADDTHGTPIMLRAEKEGITPEALIKKVHVEHSKDFSDFFVNFDNFYSTNSPENLELSHIVYKKLKQNNKIYTKTIEQFYDPAKEMCLPDRFINGSGAFLKGLTADLKATTSNDSSKDSSKDSDTTTTGTKSSSSTGGEFPTLDMNNPADFKAYEEIADKFISSRSANLLGIRGSMLADAAKNTQNKYGKYVPVELS